MEKNKVFKKALLSVLAMGLVTSMVACSDEGKPADGEAKKLDYPKRPIELVVPFGEGSASDTFARKYAEIMSKNMDKPFQPVNKDGSGGVVGMAYAHGQANDGYTVLEVTPSHVIADVLGQGNGMKFLEDFEPLARIQSDIYVLSVPANSKFKTFDDLVEVGQKDTITFAGVSPGGLDDMTLSALADASGLKVKFIPYGSGSEVKAAVLGGEVDVYIDKLINTVSYIRDGKVNPLVVLNDERITQLEELKDTPTTVEKGYDVTIGSWRGFVVKKGTPQEVKDYLVAEMKKAHETEEYQKFNAESLTDIREGFLGPEEFKKSMLEEYEAFDKVAKSIGLKEE